jgi:prepilin-type N-terminal cleavage/methylation domain-containing protein
MISRSSGRRAGLTLVEVLIALALLAVVLLPVVLGLTQALATSNESAITAAATSIARDKTEEIKVLSWSALADQRREPSDLNPGDAFFEVEVAVEVVRPDDEAHSGLKKAEVLVYRAGGAQPVARITTYVTPYGV